MKRKKPLQEAVAKRQIGQAGEKKARSGAKKKPGARRFNVRESDFPVERKAPTIKRPS